MQQPDGFGSADESASQPEQPPALWIGSALWLDFVNTRYVDRGRPREVLSSYSALVAWLAAAGALSADVDRALAARWEGTPEATGVLNEALALRDALREFAEALATQAETAAAAAMAAAAINRVLRVLVGYPELTPDGLATGAPASVPHAVHADEPVAVPRYLRRTHPVDDTPVRLLAAVADSAADLLCGVGDPSLVRRCGNPKCVLYFYDTTKNRHRRFCSASGCGNRVKAAARYRRAREAKRESSAGSVASEPQRRRGGRGTSR